MAAARAEEPRTAPLRIVTPEPSETGGPQDVAETQDAAEESGAEDSEEDSAAEDAPRPAGAVAETVSGVAGGLFGRR